MEPRPPEPPRGRVATVMYASDLLAAYETCGCAVQPMGGLARRATQVDRARRDSDAVLAVDAGDVFLPAANPPGPDGTKPAETDSRTTERRARLIARALGRMGITALAPGERDLALGLPLLRKLAAEGHIPLLSANLRDGHGRRLFAADRIVEGAGIQLGIFGITAAPTPADDAAFRAAGIEVGDPAAAARAEVGALRTRGASLIIALLHVGTPAETRRLVAEVPGIDWAVAGHSGLRLESPEPVGGARLLGVLAEGKELGRLDLHVMGGSLALADRGQRVEIETILTDHRRQLVDYDRRLGGMDPASLRDYYEARRQALERAIAREAALLAGLPRQITGSWFENRLIPLDAGTPDDPGVAAFVAAYDRTGRQKAKPSHRP